MLLYRSVAPQITTATPSHNAAKQNTQFSQKFQHYGLIPEPYTAQHSPERVIPLPVNCSIKSTDISISLTAPWASLFFLLSDSGRRETCSPKTPKPVTGCCKKPTPESGFLMGQYHKRRGIEYNVVISRSTIAQSRAQATPHPPDVDLLQTNPILLFHLHS